MATPQDLMALRPMIGDTDFDNGQLGIWIDAAEGDLNLAAARIWNYKANEYAELVDTTEAGSSRKMSDLFKNAKTQADFYQSQVATPDTTTGSYSTTRAIVRS